MEPFKLTQYYSKKKFWKIFGGEVRIYDPSRENLLFFVKQKAFKLKENITVYSDESQSTEILKIMAQSIIDFSAGYDITDVQSGEKIGTLRRKGLRSLFRDSWQILDSSGNQIGIVKEDSTLMALLRRFLSSLIPQSFDIIVDDQLVGELDQSINPFVPQFKVDFSMDTENKLDRRLGIATVILLQVIEGKQQ